MRFPRSVLSLFVVSVLAFGALVAPCVVLARRHSHSHSHVAASAPEASATTSVSIDDPNWFWSPYNWNVQPAEGGESTTQSNNPGAYFKLSFSGPSFVLLVNMTNTPSEGYMTLRWSVDGAAQASALLPYDVSGANGGSITLANNLAPNADGSPHTLSLFILNSHQGTDRWLVPLNVIRIRGALLSAGSALAPYPNLFSKRMLLYWDSIGEGVLINGRGSPRSDLTDNDSTRNFVQVLSQALQAEVGAVCYGAQGYIRPGSFHPLMNVMQDNETTFAWSRYDSHTSRLDEKGLLQPPPDFVVNGHATNDYLSPPADVALCAEAWLNAVVQAAPSSKIIVAVPFGQYQTQALHDAFQAYQKSFGNGGNPNVHIVDLAAWNAQEGLTRQQPQGNAVSADSLHPLAWRSEQLGAFLAVAIQQQLGAAQDELTQ